MKGDVKIIAHFNKLLINELTATNQFFLHARIFKNWGLVCLNDFEYRASVDEMKHVDCCFERILFLEGSPNLQDFNQIKIGGNVEDILRFDLNLELQGTKNLRDGIVYADSIRDYVSRDLMTKILIDEEEHIGSLETELKHLARIGIQNYLQLKINTS